MARAPFQILVFLYRRNEVGEFEYAIFQRADAGFWQGVAGGGEDEETPFEAAIRETHEETGLLLMENWIQLQTMGSAPVTCFADRDHWPKDLYVVPIHCFGVPVGDKDVTLSHEHTHFAWLSFKEAQECVKFDSDRTTLWELNHRLLGLAPRD